LLPTVRSTRKHHQVAAICRSCDRIRQLDLAALETAGHGNAPLIELRLRCACGSRDIQISV